MIGFATSILRSINPSKTKREREREHHEPVSQFFASKLYVQNNSIESDWIRSSPRIIWYELHFPSGCRDCTCVVSRATLTSSWSTSGETGGSGWVSWSPNIYCILLYENQNEHLDHIDIYWPCMKIYDTFGPFGWILKLIQRSPHQCHFLVKFQVSKWKRLHQGSSPGKWRQDRWLPVGCDLDIPGFYMMIESSYNGRSRWDPNGMEIYGDNRCK